MKKNILVNGNERKFLIIDLNNNYFFLFLSLIIFILIKIRLINFDSKN